MKKSAAARIDGMCRGTCLNKEEIYKRYKFILEAYRDLCWKTVRDVDLVREDLAAYCSSDMDDALIYLETFASDEDRDCFQARIQTLFDNRFMTEMIDVAISRVRAYPDYGKIYYDILTMCYIFRTCRKETELLETLGIERSNYYAKKKQAIILFGVAMHEAVKQVKEQIGKTKRELMHIPRAFLEDHAMSGSLPVT